MNEHQFLFRNPYGLLALMLAGAGIGLGFATRDESGLGMAIVAAVCWLVLMTIHVHSQLDSTHLRAWVFPIWRRTIALADIEAVEPVTYRPILDFGGWGLRFGTGKKFHGVVAYTISGKRGLLIQVKNGRPMLLGTRKSEEWLRALRFAGVPVLDAWPPERAERPVQG